MPDQKGQKGCGCEKGNEGNGGKAPNANGICKHYCSRPLASIRYCGDGPEYKTGDFVDCTDGNLKYDILQCFT